MIKRLCALLCLSLVASCDIEVQSTEMLTRHDPNKDTMKVLFLHDEVGSTEPAAGAKKVDEVLKGRRTFLLGFWPFAVDVDSHAEPDEPGADSRPSKSKFNSMFEKIGRPTAGIGTDERGRIRGWQEVTISDWSKFLAELNRLFIGEIYVKEGFLDAAAAKTHENRAWVGLDAKGWTVEIPMNDRTSTELLRQVANAGPRDDSDAQIIHEILDNLTDVEFTDLGVRLRFGTSKGPAWSLRVDAPKRKADDARKARFAELLWKNAPPPPIDLAHLEYRFVKIRR